MPKSASIPLLIFCISAGMNINAQDTIKPQSSFRDSLDNALDISDWLVTKKGALVIPTLITEPAVDYGIALAAVFFHSSYSEKKGPPSMSGVMGAATLNGTWAAGVSMLVSNRTGSGIQVSQQNLCESRHMVSGNIEILADEPVNLNLDAWLLMQQVKFRVGQTDFFIGGKYLLLATDNTFEIPIEVPEFDTTEFSSTLSEVSLKLELDSRNNVLTPTEGLFIGLSGTYSDTWLGGDSLWEDRCDDVGTYSCR
jgi:hypothetical protein